MSYWAVVFNAHLLTKLPVDLALQQTRGVGLAYESSVDGYSNPAQPMARVGFDGEEEVDGLRGGRSLLA